MPHAPIEDMDLLGEVDDGADQEMATAPVTSSVPKGKVPAHIRQMFLEKHAQLMDEQVVPIV